MYVVTGATGNTGEVVAEKLLAAGVKVRVIGRDPKKLERFTRKGAEPFVADLTNAESTEKAFSGATAVFAMVPPNIAAPDVLAQYGRVGHAIAAGIKKHGINYAVALSSVGADKPDRTGVVKGLHNLEEIIGEIAGLNVLFLRAGYFMENLLPQVGVIQSFGIMGGPVRSDLPLPLIATHDIGAVAAEALLNLNFTGKSTRELQGARDVTYAECAKIIGAAIGKANLAYMQLPAPQLKPAFMQMGMSSNMADGLLELAEALNSGHLRMLEPRSPANTTPTTIETFVADTFVPAYREKAASG
jgi:uncharacterized protein YbjT (DUF2867 family)